MCANEKPRSHQQKPGSLSSMVDERAQERVNNQRDSQNYRSLPRRLLVIESISMFHNVTTMLNHMRSLAFIPRKTHVRCDGLDVTSLDA